MRENDKTTTPISKGNYQWGVNFGWLGLFSKASEFETRTGFFQSGFFIIK
jgi:hypothetical protein